MRVRCARSGCRFSSLSLFRFVLFCYFVIRLCSRVDLFFWDLKFGFNRGVLFGCSNNHQRYRHRRLDAFPWDLKFGFNGTVLGWLGEASKTLE